MRNLAVNYTHRETHANANTLHFPLVGVSLNEVNWIAKEKLDHEEDAFRASRLSRCKLIAGNLSQVLIHKRCIKAQI